MKYYQSDTYKTFAFITVHTQNLIMQKEWLFT